MLRTCKRFLPYMMLSMMAILPLASTDIYLPLFSDMTRYFHADVSWLQISISLFVLGLALGQLLFVVCSNYLGVKYSFILFMLFYISASITCAWTSSIEYFNVARLFQSLGASAALVAWQPLVVSMFSKDRAKSVTGLIFILICVSPAIAPFIGATSAVMWGIKACFVILSIYALILCFLMLVLPTEIANHPRKMNPFFPSVRALCADAHFIRYLTLIANNYSGYMMFLVAYPVLLMNDHRDAVNISILFIPTAIAFVIGVTLGNFFGVKNHPDKNIYWGLISYSLSVLLLLATLTVGYKIRAMLLMLAFCALNVGNGMLFPTASLQAISLMPNISHISAGLMGFTRMMFAFILWGVLSLVKPEYLIQTLCLLLVFSCVVAWRCFMGLAPSYRKSLDVA